MKRKYIILLMLPVVMLMFALQSCTKKNNGYFVVYHAFTVPSLVAPLDGTLLKITGTTVDLKWASTNADNNPPIADVYFGTSNDPGLYKGDNPGLTLTVPVTVGTTYYWHVTMKDAHGVMTYGPTWSFTVFDPISIFLGDYTADEPAESYSYGVSFVKTGPNTIETSNYWNSGWAATFTLDLTAKTYSMPLTTWGNYSGIESGTIDPATGTMVGSYTIYYKGGSIEEGVHTYTKL